MTFLRRLLCVWVVFSFLGTSIALPPAHAQSASADASGLLFHLPTPGSRVGLSSAFQPVLIKGLRVHPENPFMFDFIVDPGEEKLGADDFKKVSQRMVNYFLASLAVPEKDLWVNLSPLEKDHIIPDTLIKTELGRDLLAEDYMLKQIGASLIYPESNLGKTFWSKVYDEAYRKFGVTQVPVNVFNKIWILPEKAKVFEKGNSVYIVQAHLKVMLEEDYLAQKILGRQINKKGTRVAVKDVSKQVLREIIVPAIEKEVNEGRNFAQLRQVFYALILAQWYQDVFKEAILNKDYAGRNKVAGIDVSDPKNKDIIYRQYLAAYKKGVFNYIKEETDQLSSEPVPRKYFSGGFIGQKVKRESASADDMAMASAVGSAVELSVVLKASYSEESRSKWNDLKRPLGLLEELKGLIENGKFNRPGLYAFIDKYSAQVDSQKRYPVQGAWPVLKAITLLEKSEEEDLVKALQERYSNPQRPELVDKILLMNNIFDRETWLKERAPHLVGRRVYLLAAEIHHWAGGLGPVMKFHGKGMKDLGADVSYIEPWYQLRRDKGNPDGDPLNYEDPDIGLTHLDYNFAEFDVAVGDINGRDIRNVHVKVATGIDENGIRVYMFRDVQEDGSSYYTRMLYNYGGRNNPVSKEESMAFLNIASAELLKRLEDIRKEKQQNWKPAIVHSNDGQYAPLQAVALSKYGATDAIKNIIWAFTTHTYRNRGSNNESKDARIRNINGAIDIFLKHMMRVKNRFINAFRQFGYIDYTRPGVELATWAGAVSDKHRDDVAGLDPNANLVSVTNGAVPEEMAAVFREEFKKLQHEGKIPEAADFERPTAEEDALVKIESKKRLNEAQVKTANGGIVKVDLDKPLIGYDRRLVVEKAGRERAFTDDNIWMLVELGYNVVLMGNHQGTDESERLASGLRELEKKIAAEKGSERASQYPGSFQFVDSFTPQQKKIFLAAADIQIQDSDNHTGAAEFSEEDITANGGYEGGPTYREGVIVDQGIPGLNTLVPQQDTARSWLETVYIPLIKLWNKDPDHLSFYKNAALSPRLNRIQRYLITSATYLRQYNGVIERQEEQAQVDKVAQKNIIDALGNNRDNISRILGNGRNGVVHFGFIIDGQGRFEADGGGLIKFLEKKKQLEEEYGEDVFLNHLFRGDFQHYLEGLLDHTASTDSLRNWIVDFDNDTETPPLEKEKHFGQFVDGLTAGFEKRLQAMPDAAMRDPGGIKFSHINLERQGSLSASIAGTSALEQVLLEAKGVSGVIVGVTPIPNLLNFIQ